MMDEGRTPSRGSYELYDSHKAFLSSGEGRGRASPAVAPGCPGSPQDMQQMVEEMSVKLNESKIREEQLRQIISDFRPAPKPEVTLASAEEYLMNADGASGSPGLACEEENVKDGRILHLQRQITVLQANLQKAEALRVRYGEAMHERDQAIDQHRAVLTQLDSVRGDNERLQQETGHLRASCVDLQQKVLQLSKELEMERRHERCQSQVAKLQEQLSTSKANLTTLKESVSRLSQENKGLKEHSFPGSQTSLTSNPACSQELEYLHSVVDTLKTTVLEQRNFLLSMKTAPSPSPSRMVNGGQGDSPPVSGARAPGSAQTKPPSGDFVLNNGVQYPDNRTSRMAVLPNQASQMGGLAVIPTSQAGLEHFSTTGAKQEVVTMAMAGSDFQGSATSHPAMSAVAASGDNKPQGEGLTNRGTGGWTKRPLQAQVSAPVRKVSQTEVIARRANSDAVVPKARAKTEVIVRQDATSSENRAYENWMIPSTGVTAPTQPALLQFQTAVPSRPPLQAGVQYEGCGGQYALATAPMVTSAQRFPGQFLAQQQQQQFVYSPMQLENGGPVQVANTTGGGRVLQAEDTAAPTPMSTAVAARRAFHDSPVVQSAWQSVGGLPNHPLSPSVGGRGAVMYEASPFEEPGLPEPPGGGQLNADRVCPVCSRNFGELSMEEFQTHVFECVDDEAAPETLRPPAPTEGDRFCPMCNTRFGSHTQQAEYEKHVHGHFGEELPGENFEILDPQ